MIPETWITELHQRIAAHPDWHGELPSDTADHWLAALRTVWPDKQRAGVMIRIGLKACKANCPYPPTAEDFIAEAISESEQPWAQALLENLPERQQSANPMADALESLAQGAKSETAQAEVTKMRRVLKGESVEAVTGITLSQHRQRLYGV